MTHDVARQENRIGLAPLAWGAALVPLIAIHASYLLSAIEGLVPWCLPWLEGCSSISRAARHSGAYFVFKGTMLPGAMLLVLYWWANRFWLLQLGSRHGFRWWLGAAGALLLILYAVALGHMGDTMYLLHRIGVLGFFGLSYVAQVELGAALWRGAWPELGRVLLLVSLVALLVGLGSLAAGILWPQRHDAVEDGVEWTLAVLLNTHSLIVAWGWQRSRFAARFSTQAS